MKKEKLRKILINGSAIIAIAILLNIGKNILFPPEPQIIEVPVVTQEAIQEKIPELTENDAKDLTKQIIKAKEEKAPDEHWIAADEETSDKKAQKRVKTDKADKLIKETTVKPIEGTNETFVEANYYAINLNRKHEVKLGATVIDGTPYASLGYRNRDIEYTAYYGSNGNVGAGIAVTIAKW